MDRIKSILQRRPMWYQLGLIISGTMYTALLVNTTSKYNFAAAVLCALIVMCVLVIKFKIDRFISDRRPLPEYILSVVLTLSAVYTAKSSFYSCCKLWLIKAIKWLGLSGQAGDLMLRLAPWLTAIVALPAALCYMLWFVDFMVRLIRWLWEKSDYIDRMYYISAAILFAMFIVFTYVCTQAFYGAFVNGIRYDYDLIYSADSGNLVSLDVFRNIGAAQNDTRQPLYGLFSMPFAQTAWLLSRALFFWKYSYVTLLQIIQVLLLLMAVILIAMQLEINGIEKALFYVMISFSYPVLIFSLTVEQYLMAIFWLILLVHFRKERPAGDLFYIAATGSLLTTGVLFPLVTWDRKIKNFAFNTIKLCGAFFAVTILCGRLTTLLELPESLSLYSHYSGADVNAISKLMQFVNFSGATLFAPASQFDDFTYQYHVSFQMVPVTTWRISGLLALAAAIAGVILGRKKYFSKVCGAWILFSFILLGIIGWGTIDNGLFLYALYFGWAYIAMVFQAIHITLAKVRPVKITVLSVLILLMIMVNISTLREAIVFATQFYPNLG